MVFQTKIKNKFLRNKPERVEILVSARQRREEERKRFIEISNIQVTVSRLQNSKFSRLQTNLLRLIREQQRQVSKVLLDGLYDFDSPISILLGDHHVVMEKVWQEMLVKNWQIFPNQ